MHLHISDQAGNLTDALRSQRTLRILVLILVPIAIWTIAALVWMWPGDVASHIRQDSTTRAIPGMTTPRATVTQVDEMSCDGVAGSAAGDQSRCARIKAQLDEGPEQGQEVEVSLTAAVYSSGVEVGDGITLYRTPVNEGPAAYQFADFQRTVPMVVLTLVFVAAVIAVARLRGAISLLGLAFAGWVMVAFMFPALIEGQNPVLVGLVGSSAIMFVVLYAAHGISARTTTALVGTLFGLFLSAGLGWAATEWAHLTGVASEDDFVLAASAPDLTLTSVVICGVIIAGLGVLNDVTITQASAVWELNRPSESARSVFTKAMRIGRDHIASSVYTTAFASAGAVLGVMLLLTIYQRPLFATLITEQFAGEVVRTLVASIGLVLSVPVTTAIAVAIVKGSTRGTAPVDEVGANPVTYAGDELVDDDDILH